MPLYITTDPRVIARIGDMTIYPRPRVSSGHQRLRKIYERDEGICQICGDPVTWGTRKRLKGKAPSIDHKVRWCEGGCNRDENLRLAHVNCNTALGLRDELRKIAEAA